MVRPILKHPFESMKYMIHSIEPAVAITYLRNEYRKNNDERVADAIRYYIDKWKGIVDQHYSKVDTRRQSSLLSKLSKLEEECLSSN